MKQSTSNRSTKRANIKQKQAAALISSGRQPCGLVTTKPEYHSIARQSDRHDSGADGGVLAPLLALLTASGKLDFRAYRRSSLLRRIQRRVDMSNLERLEDYYFFIRDQPEELNQLIKDLLAGDTSFFRDQGMFQSLETQTVPTLLHGHASGHPVRIWVPACASGEEAYSIAMIFLEQIAANQKKCPVQICATDVDRDALEVARIGIYSAAVMADVAPERIARFFESAGDKGYQVGRELREAVQFAEHNLLIEAPFSDLDMVSCRNLLANIDSNVQKQIVAMLHHALRESGVLVLGLPETAGARGDLFEPISRKWRIYRRIGSRRHEHPGSHNKSRNASRKFPSLPGALASWRMSSIADLTQPNIDHGQTRSNEERNASSKEIKSTNKDLDHSKEEAQPINEWLLSANSKLQKKLEEVETANSDMTALLTNSGIATVFLGSDGTIKRFTPAATLLFNLTAVDLGRPFSNITARFIDPELAADIESVLQVLDMSQREVFTSEGRWFLRRITPYHAGDNRIAGVVITLTDITFLKLTEGGLRKLSSELEQCVSERTAQLAAERALIAGILDTESAAIYVLDREGRIIRVNAAFEAVSGYAFAEVAGKTLLETVIPVDFAEAFQACLSTVIKRDSPQRMEVFWQRKDGSRRWIESSKQLLRGPNGEVESIVGVAIDRTRWRKTATELLGERNFVASILETAAAFVVVLDPHGRIVRPNEAFVAATGYSLETLQSMLIWDLLPDQDVEALRQVFLEIRSGRIASYRHASALLHSDGSRRKVEWASTCLLDGSEKLQFFVVTGIDITEKQRGADQLRDRAEELAELHRRYMANGLGVVAAHELSQPLTAIASYSEGSLKRIRQGSSSTEDLIHDLEQIGVQAHRAAFVIRRLRDFLGKTGVEVKVEELNAVVSVACDLFFPLAYQHDVRIVMDFGKKPVSVLVERIRVEHVLINLFQNAVEAIRGAGMPNGQIRVQTGVDAKGAGCVTIRDSGPGVRDQDVERIFDRFYTTEAQGMGLGLPISRALIEAQGGRLWAEPSAEGAIFRFTVPLAP